MVDTHNRIIDYLRISVTDRCNLRCCYCMPAHGVAKREHNEILRAEEILEIARAAADCGIRKLRVTGGEPLVRRGIVALCRDLAGIPGIEELALTTNGALLPGMAADLKAAGVRRVNVSIDSLRPERYTDITRGGDLTKAVAGIRAAFAAGLTPVKLNAVLIGGVNDDEIVDIVELTRRYPLDVRFIELMPVGEGLPLWKSGYLPNETVLQRVPALVPAPDERGVARYYQLPGAPGRVGLINPVSNHFCQSCNRLRLTADGMLKPCLHSAVEIPVRGLTGDALRQEVRRAILTKPEGRNELSADSPSDAGRRMNQIGG